MSVDTRGYARICDMEPGFRFRERHSRHPYTWAGIDPVRTSAGGRQYVRVLTEEGVSWVCDKTERFPLVSDAR